MTQILHCYFLNQSLFGICLKLVYSLLTTTFPIQQKQDGRTNSYE